MRKCDPELTAQFDTAIAAAIADGTVEKLSETVVQDRHDAAELRLLSALSSLEERAAERGAGVGRSRRSSASARAAGALALLEATAMTLVVSPAASSSAPAIGSLVAWAQLSGSFIARGLGEGYTTILRGIPELLIIYLFYFGASTR